MYLEIDEGYPGHRKTLRLCALLKCDTADAYPPRLWTWATRSAPDGDLTGMDPTEVEMAIRYRGKPGTLFEALVRAGFIDQGEDGSITIHNWTIRTGGAILKMGDRAYRVRERRAHKDGKCLAQCSLCAAHDPGTSQAHPNQDQTRPVQTSQDQTSPLKENSAETAPPSSPPLMVFPCDGKVREWFLTQAQVDEWAALFPALDVLAICRQALAWVKATPAKRKTADGMPRFLVAWFTRDQNRGRTGSAQAPRPAPESFAARDERERRGERERTKRELDAAAAATDAKLAGMRVDPSKLPTREELAALRNGEGSAA